MTEIHEINHLCSLTGYGLLWKSLFDQTPNAGFQQSFEWLQQYWRHYGEGKKLRVLIVKSAGRNVGILPLCVVRRKHRLGTLRELTYPIDNWGTYFGPLGKSRTATLAAGLRHVAQTDRDWDTINLGWTSGNAGDHLRTEVAMQQVGFTPKRELQHHTSSIDFTPFADWNDYLAAIPKKQRHEFRRHERRVSKHGQVEFIRHRPDSQRAGDGDPRWDLYDECEHIARNSWQAQSSDGNTLCNREHVGFFRDTHAAAARLGMLDMAVLRLDGQPVAFMYAYQHQGRVAGLRMGYDANTPIGGVGNVLLGRFIADSIEQGDQHLDLGPGHEEYKPRVRTSTDAIYQLTHASRAAFHAQVVETTHWVRQRFFAPA